jgi:hypothetical protein
VSNSRVKRLNHIWVQTRTTDYRDFIRFGNEHDCRYSVLEAPHTGCNARHHYNFHANRSVQRKCIFKYNQQDATLHNLFISVICSTCFRRFLRPSSGAQNFIYSIGYLVQHLLLRAIVVEEVELATCLRRFLRPSSGAQTVYTTSGTKSKLYCYLPLSWKRCNCFQLFHDSGR